MSIHAQWLKSDTYLALQRTSSTVKDPSWLVPKPLVVVIKINGQEAQALVDIGSLGDFISGMLVDQLKLKQKELKSPIGLQMAIQGS
ncbi:hypothetical protein P691DRAFT_681841 [Macrolepiota fuliginosa MF-IS2]|uniref:Retropepsins domain-containing protein n=1 Tax=Macrolepiota fuliginosa MF-IS2 TaxID=1400762 RepID=A0A9P6BY99_9AGAR|nr:hypothetical protein P691DRAFT_681841 [Macrolepiota fuliginosa MF-IS2]